MKNDDLGPYLEILGALAIMVVLTLVTMVEMYTGLLSGRSVFLIGALLLFLMHKVAKKAAELDR